MLPKAKVWHDIRSDENSQINIFNTQKPWRLYYTGRNRILFHKKYSPFHKYFIFSLFFLPILTLYYVFMGIKSNSKNKMKKISFFMRGTVSGLLIPINRKRNMKVAIVSTYAPTTIGGLESVVNGIIKVLSNSEKEIDITVFHRGGSEEKGRYKSKVIRVAKIPIISDIIYNLICGLKCIFGNYDIVHTHGANGAGYAFMRKIVKDDAKFIHTFHGISYRALECYIKNYKFPKSIILKAYRSVMSYLGKKTGQECDIAVAVSKGVKIELIKDYKIPEEKIIVIHNAVDTNLFKPRSKDKAKELLGLNKNKKYILFVGKEIFRKGLDIAIDIMDYLKDVDVALLTVGTDKSNSQRSNVVNLGWISNNKLIAIYNAVDILILPSRYEGHPITALEALASGLPLIASKTSNVEIIGRNQGFIVENKPEKYAFEIKKNLRKDTLSKMSKSCRKLALRYSVEKQYKKYLKLYLE